ncbi:MAG: RHS repeat-associated core domain-containing protein [Ferruginibacter sp.]
MGVSSFKGKHKSYRNLLQAFVLLLTYAFVFNCVSAQNLSRPNITGYAGLQVNSYTGNLFYQRTDLVLPAKGMPVDLSFAYNSSDRDNNTGFGYGWTFTYNQFYEANPTGGLTFHRADGRKDVYLLFKVGIYTRPKGIFDELIVTAPGKFVLKTKEGVQYFFEDDTHKKLTRIVDRNGNEIKLAYNGGNLSSITDASGHVFSFQWGAGVVTKITTAAGAASRSFNYGYRSGYLVAVSDPANNSISYDYGNDRTLTQLTDGNGNKNVVVYNNHVAVKSIISCQGEKSFIYNGEQGQVYVLEGGEGISTRTTYYFDPLGRLQKREGNCCGFNITYGYDGDNNINYSRDARGNTSTYGYDGKGNLLTETDALGKTIFYTYEPVFNQVKSIRDKRGKTTGFDYDGNGNLKKITDPYSQTLQYEYNPDGTLKTAIDKKGRKTEYTYDAYGYVSTVKDRALGSTGFLHDAWGNTLTITDAENRTRTYTYDSLNRQVKEISPYGNLLREYSYDRNGNRTAVKDANAHTTEFYYDGNDKLIGYKDALGNNAAMRYDVLGNRVAKTDVLNHTTNYTYDSRNLLLSETNAEGDQVRYEYDNAGNKTAVYYPNGNIVNIGYDLLNRVTKISDKAGLISEYTYDENSNKLSEKNALGNTVSYKYDFLNRLAFKYDALGNNWNYQYDENDNLVSVTDRRGKATVNAYDSLDRMWKTTDATGAVTIYSFDKTGNQLAVNDAKGNTTRYKYDLLNRDSVETFADNTTKAYTYDLEGNVKTRKDNRGRTTSYAYDALNRPIARIYPSSVDSFAYYANGLMQMAKNTAATIGFTYDRADRLISETLNGKTTGYAYNVAAGIKTIAYPGGRVIQRQTDSRNYLKAIMENGKELAGFDYNAAGQNIAKRYGNNTASTINYNSNGQIIDLTYGPAQFASLAYTYDKEGNPTTGQVLNRTSSSESYTYDDINQLKSFSKGMLQSLFDYDGTGNRSTAQINGTTATYTTSKMNAYTNIVYGSTIAPAYDLNGNITNDGRHNYSYDDENRMIAADGGATATYAYDALGRRIKKVTGTTTINYFFDGQQIIEEHNATDNTVATYVWGTWIDGIVCMRRNNNDYYYHTNNIGSVTAITNGAGAVVERYEYDAFGKLSVFNANYNPIATSGIGNTYTFTGRQYEQETGLFFYRARHYDAEHGRFLQRDPLGYVDGLGLYTYAGNNPINESDPLGLSWIDDFLDNHIDNSFINAYGNADLSWLKPINNGLAGYSDIITLGTTNYLRELLGTNGAVDKCSRFYRLGEVAGMVGGVGGLIKGLPNIYNGLKAVWQERTLIKEAAQIFRNQLSNQQLVQKSATLAERAIGGTGRFAGTAKHQYANKLLNRYQSIYGDRGLRPNFSFNNGVGNRGFLDVLDQTNGIIYDFKFGKAVMSSAQYNKYFRNFELPIQIIRP